MSSSTAARAWPVAWWKPLDEASLWASTTRSLITGRVVRALEQARMSPDWQVR